MSKNRKKVDLGDAKCKEVQKKRNWIPVTPAKPILERLRLRRRNEDSKQQGLSKPKEVQKKGNWIPVTPVNPILERLRPRRRNEDNRQQGLRRIDHSKPKEVQKKGNWVPVTPANPILERLRPRQRNDDSKQKGLGRIKHSKPKEVQKRGNWIPVTPAKLNLERLRPRRRNKDSKQRGLKRIKHSKPKVLFEKPATLKHASIEANLFANGNNVVNNSFRYSALASSSNELIGEAVVPRTPEPTSRRFKRVFDYYPDNHETDERQIDDSKLEERSIRDNCHKIEQNNLCAINQPLCREYSLRVYQRKSRVKQPPSDSRKLGPNSPRIGKQKIRGRRKVNVHSSLFSVITADVHEKDCGKCVEEEADKDKEKWMKKEREVYCRRIERFIELMRCIQGNRTFSPWKGSVVDSIVGVFLTQNVSDHLSSSAFMSLAARYPNTQLHQVNILDSQDKQEQVVNESSLQEHISSSGLTVNETERKKDMLRRKKGKYQKKIFNWAGLWKEHSNCIEWESGAGSMDSVNWQAVRFAEPKDISAAIFARGMNNNLTERIQDFLNRLVRELKSIDLEWLRNVPPEEAKEFLMGINGLGLKSSECVRLLTLKQLAFPVDTNVGRIAVRLGWVPLQTLPEMIPLHLLNEYPKLDDIQKYLWPRLRTLDQGTLYELHYQMITFGKVFCTKRRPNCNACPLRGECKYFASAFASERLALPRPRKKTRRTSIIPIAAAENRALVINPTSSFLPEANPFLEVSERDIEDSFYMDPDEIPLMQLKMEEFTENLWNYMDDKNLLPEEGYISKALVALTSEDAKIPLPKLKYSTRLRTEHLVYELPKSHPLLTKLDRQDPDEPCPYLLAIWPPGESENSVEPPKCVSQESEQCYDKRFSLGNNTREEDSQTVLGTFLIPCRTALRGSFPLNGTYFQVNEVFADDESSQTPITVPMSYIQGLPRRTLYCGTSTSMICKGLSTRKIQHCFWRGFICLRGFNRQTRAPRPLAKRFHLQANPESATETKYIEVTPHNLEEPNKADMYSQCSAMALFCGPGIDDYNELECILLDEALEIYCGSISLRHCLN